ncbi:MAG: stage III sporulation protein AB [Firmicutes bacterium]|nr:stage III sporulation protein AB [Bacillota bacterium]
MYKLIGAAMVVAAGQMIGTGIGRQYRQRSQELRTLQSALLFLQTEIGYTATPLPEALERVARNLEFPLREVFAETAGGLRRHEGTTAGEAWAGSLEKYSGYLALKPRDLGILKNLGEALGKSGREEQEKHLLLAREQLQQEERQAESERLRYEPLYRYSGLLVGLLIVIVLL